MITRFRVQNYKALRDVQLDLTPLHVLVGPNDSGKSSILEAIAALCRSVEVPLTEAFAGDWEGRQLVRFEASEPDVHLEVGGVLDDATEFSYLLGCRFAIQARNCSTWGESVQVGAEPARQVGTHGPGDSVVRQVAHTGQSTNQFAERLARAVYGVVRGVQVCRWNPRTLALPCAPDASRQFRIDASGFGLALCIDNILGADRSRFDRLEARFKRVFPNVTRIQLLPREAFRTPSEIAGGVPLLQKSDGKGLYFQIENSPASFAASQVSDGMLLILAYLTILNLPNPPRMILVEEPENGVHPSRLREVITILRELVEESKQTQVVMTTHSPYLVDLFKPEEVTLCLREDDGSVSTHRLSDSPTVSEQLKHFKLGEIWTGEGDDSLAREIAASAGK
ncbi:MAG: AAA family ATPase [Phycisphaerae bacterium]